MSQASNIISAAYTAQYAGLPKIELPGDDARLLECAKSVLPHVKDQGLFRRDSVVMVANDEKRRLEAMDSATFRTWVEDYVAFFKTRSDPKTKDSWDVYRSIPQEAAQAILSSRSFWPKLPEIEKTLSVPLPVNGVVGEDGVLGVGLTAIGYSVEHKTYTYKHN